MLDVKNDDGVLVLTLNRPEAKNALCPPLVESIIEAFEQAAADPDTRVVVFTGAPPLFTAGMDVKVFSNINDPTNRNLLENRVPAMFDTMIDFPKPIVGAVNGVGVGYGATVLGLCDIVIMAQSARLVAPFASLGVGPEAASSFTLPERMGWQEASWFLYSCQWMDAEACRAAGLALDVVPDDALLDEAMKRARVMAAHSVNALMATKRMLMAPRREQLREANHREMQRFVELIEEPAGQEGLQAFFEKRAPEFQKAGL